MPIHWARLCESIGNNRTLTDLNLNYNQLGQKGVCMVATQLRGASGLCRLGFSYNEPGVEPSLAELLRTHPSLTSIELVEANDRHLPSRAKDDLGRALIENPARRLGFLHCDQFTLSEQVRTLNWGKDASTSDAILLAGVLRTNTVLTTFNIAAGAILENKARSEIGSALLNNPNSSVAFCNDFGLTPTVETCEFDLSKSELKDVEPFRLLAGCLRGNHTLTHVTLLQLRMEQIPTLALALRGNNTLKQLELISTSRAGGQAVVRLPVPDLNGIGSAPLTHVDLSKACVEGSISRIACATIGTLTSTNTVLECLDLSETGVGLAIGAEGEGGHILFKPLCESRDSHISEIRLNSVQLNDKAGGKLISALAAGLGAGDLGYEKVMTLSLANNDLGKQFAIALKQLLWSERAQCVLRSLDVSHNIALDGFDLTLALKRNDSLTSLDLRGVPSANSDQMYEFLGQHLLQEDCMSRLGYLSCDAFQVVAGQTELIHGAPSMKSGDTREPHRANEADTAKEGARASSVGSNQVEPIILLLAGVVKFNTSLLLLKIVAGLNDRGASSIATAMRENKTLERLDLSGDHRIGPSGVQEIAGACRTHPKLDSIKMDGAALPTVQLCGAPGADPSVDMSNQELGELSGYAIGTLLSSNALIAHLNMSSNLIGASGTAGALMGLGEAPLKTLNISRTGLAEADDAALETLSVASKDALARPPPPSLPCCLLVACL